MNFVFDLGNVMVYFQPDAFLTGLGYTGETREALKKAIFGSHWWLDMDAGIITRAQQTDGICADNPELETDIRRVMACCDDMLQPIPNSVRAIEYLTDAGYGCYYLSNTNEPALEFMSSFDYFKRFKGGVASYADKVSKPDPAIFELFAGRFGLNPAECVFIDDNAANVEAAQSCGYIAYRLADPDGLFALIEEIMAQRRASGQNDGK